MTAPESSVVRGGSNAQSVARGPVQASGSPARVPDSAVSAAGVAESRAKLARSNDASSAQQSEASGSAPRARQSRPPGSAFELDKRSDAAVAPAPKAIAPNPFPAAPPPSAAARGRLGADAPSGSGNAAVPLTPGSAAAPFARDNAQAALAPQSARAREPAPATADADPAQRLEKPSLLSEPTESRMANQPVPEVHDSAPTYPNEMRPSLPLPYTYTVPRAATRESASKSAAAPGSGAAPPSAAAVGALASRSATVASAAQQSSAIRKEEALERRAPEKAASSMPAAPATMFAAAPPPRDPVQWIKDIQKLRSEGKAEQVTKELAEFRKQYPQYLLPDELKNIK